MFTGLLGVVASWEILKGRLKVLDVMKQPVFLMLGGCYALYLALSTWLVALSPTVSFWGTYQRHSGLVTYGLLGVFGVLLFLWLRKTERIQLVLRTVFWSTTVLGVFALLHALLPSFFGDTVHTYGRVYAFMGHPNYLGQTLLVGVLLSLYYLIRERNKKNGIEWMYLVTLAVSAGGLFATGNRASMVAALFGGTLLVLLVPALLRMKRQRRDYLYVGTGVIWLVAGLVASQILMQSPEQTLRSLESRLAVVPATMEVIERSPWFGYGLDSYGFAFAPVYPPVLAETEKFTDVPDKAHNEVLDLLVEQGLYGVFFWFAAFALLLVGLWKLFTSKGKREEKLLAALGLTLVLAMEVSQLSGFAVLTTRLYMVVFVVMLLRLLPERGNVRELVFTRYLVAGLLLAGGAALMVCGARLFLGDLAYAEAKAGDVAAYEQSLTSPYPYEYQVFAPSNVDTSMRMGALLAAGELNNYDYYIPLQIAWMMLGKQQGTYFVEQAYEICPSCARVRIARARHYAQLDDPTFDTEEERRVDASLYAEYFQDFPSFMLLEASKLTPYQQERRRIFLKEQGSVISDLEDYLALLPKEDSAHLFWQARIEEYKAIAK